MFHTTVFVEPAGPFYILQRGQTSKSNLQNFYVYYSNCIEYIIHFEVAQNNFSKWIVATTLSE